MFTHVVSRICLGLPLALVLFLQLNFIVFAMQGVFGAGSPWPMKVVFPILLVVGTLGHLYGRTS